jgi:hypothetical protein
MRPGAAAPTVEDMFVESLEAKESRMRKSRLAIAIGAIVSVALAAPVAVAIALATGDAASPAAAKAATAKYHNLSAAETAGYSLLRDTRGIACIAMPHMAGMAGGAMGVHWAKGPYVADGKIEPLEPEALVYAPDHGTLRLAAVEYVVLQAAWDAHHAAPPVLFGHEFNLTPAGNRFGLPAFYSLHAWLWKHNPAGEFAMWNPEVHCA